MWRVLLLFVEGVLFLWVVVEEEIVLMFNFGEYIL